MNTNAPREWVSLTEASRRLNIHIRTVELHMNKGKLSHQWNASGKFEVLVPAVMPTPEVAFAITQQAEKSTSLAESHLIEVQKELRRARGAFRILSGIAASLLLFIGALAFAWVNAREDGVRLEVTASMLKEQVTALGTTNAHLQSVLADAATARQLDAETPWLLRSQ